MQRTGHVITLGDTMQLIYSMPTEREAREWNQRNPRDNVSAFACRYPGHYTEAAAALQRVRRSKKG